MSKAFTSDSDEEGDILEAPAFPPGTRNYMTKAGADRLQSEINRLVEERKGTSSDVEGKSRLQKIDRRLRYLTTRLETLEVIDPLTQPTDRVLFGATATVVDGTGHTETWRIVGLDESNLDSGWISWMSPLASALLEKRVGDRIPFMGRLLTLHKIIYEC